MTNFPWTVSHFPGLPPPTNSVLYIIAIEQKIYIEFATNNTS